MGATRNGIYYDLRESIFIFNTGDLDEEIELRFSSMRNLQRYLLGVDEHIETINRKLSNMLNVDVHNDTMGLLSYYFQIERRGCYIRTGKEIILWQNEVSLQGENVMRKTLETL
nr:MAG TPA: transcriptional regulator [Caudoviricetes sp.]